MEETLNNADQTKRPYLFQKGNKFGKGRPKGSISIKEKIRQHLEANPEEVKEIVNHFVKNNRELMWQMLEGKPRQPITGEDSEGNPIPLLGGDSNYGKRNLPEESETN